MRTRPPTEIMFWKHSQSNTSYETKNSRPFRIFGLERGAVLNPVAGHIDTIYHAEHVSVPQTSPDRGNDYHQATDGELLSLRGRSGGKWNIFDLGWLLSQRRVILVFVLRPLLSSGYLFFQKVYFVVRKSDLSWRIWDTIYCAEKYIISPIWVVSLSSSIIFQ